MNDLSKMTIAQLAALTKRDWAKPHYTAAPYLNAMLHMQSTNDKFGLDSGEEVVLRFLCNCQTWHGETARRVKAELRKRVNI